MKTVTKLEGVPTWQLIQRLESVGSIVGDSPLAIELNKRLLKKNMGELHYLRAGNNRMKRRLGIPA